MSSVPPQPVAGRRLPLTGKFQVFSTFFPLSGVQQTAQMQPGKLLESAKDALVLEIVIFAFDFERCFVQPACASIALPYLVRCPRETTTELDREEKQISSRPESQREAI